MAACSCCAAEDSLQQVQAGGVEDTAETEGHLGDRVRLQISKLRSCDLVRLRVRDVCHGNVIAARTPSGGRKFRASKL
jgi:hypothetical protein